MKNILSLIALTLFAVLTPQVSKAYDDSSTLLMCASCQTVADFTATAKTGAAGRVGTWEFLVANYNTNKIYDITVEVSYEREVRRYIYLILRSNEIPVSDEQSFARLYPAFSQSKQVHLEAPAGGGEGLNSFRGSEQGMVCTAFTGTADFVALANEMRGSPASILAKVLKQYFGRGPTGIYVFANGDVATYELYPLLPGVTACKYVAGTARDPLGRFINDQGVGGGGASNGSPYVRNNGQGGYWVYASNYTLSCAYLEHADGTRTLIGCTVLPN